MDDLFGQNLGDHIRAIKAVEKSGKELKGTYRLSMPLKGRMFCQKLQGGTTYTNPIIGNNTEEVGNVFAGRLKMFYGNWKPNKNPVVLEWISGYRINFLKIPQQNIPPHSPKLSDAEYRIVQEELNKLMQQGVVVKGKPKPLHIF